jgi:DNA-binding CsgD family transcriptional regulator
VLFLLMSGDSRKQIASKLKISPNTVADHVQAIYRQFGVNSRGELLGRFITGGLSAPNLQAKAVSE